MVLNHFKENPEAIKNVTAPLYEEKVVDFILELANVTEKKVPLAKFIETLEKENEEQEKKNEKRKKKEAKKPAAKKKAPPKKPVVKGKSNTKADGD
jgi:trigger factor